MRVPISGLDRITSLLGGIVTSGMAWIAWTSFEGDDRLWSAALFGGIALIAFMRALSGKEKL